MTIKERVLASMKTSYAKYGFKKDELNSLADIVVANLTEDSTDEDVTSAVKTAEAYASMMQTVYNRGISETNKKYEGYIPKPDPKPEPDPKPKPEPKQLTAEEIQKMISEGIANGLKPYQERAEKERLNSLLQNHSKLKSIPKIFREKYSLDKEEDLDNVVSKIEDDYTSFKQELVSSGQFVESPKESNQQSETDDFVETMKQFSQRNSETKQ